MQGSRQNDSENHRECEESFAQAAEVHMPTLSARKSTYHQEIITAFDHVPAANAVQGLTATMAAADACGSPELEDKFD